MLARRYEETPYLISGVVARIPLYVPSAPKTLKFKTTSIQPAFSRGSGPNTRGTRGSGCCRLYTFVQTRRRSRRRRKRRRRRGEEASSLLCVKPSRPPGVSRTSAQSFSLSLSLSLPVGCMREGVARFHIIRHEGLPLSPFFQTPPSHRVDDLSPPSCSLVFSAALSLPLSHEIRNLARVARAGSSRPYHGSYATSRRASSLSHSPDI